jgi:hypothetical protein
MAEHDHGYKLLFSHPRMVEDLVRGFVEGPWVAELDFSTLERMQASYVTEDLAERASDVVWRLRGRDERWVYLYLLIEFQSTVDRFMALRMLTYVGLLGQDLVRQRVWDARRRLPAILPIVLYNGPRRWWAAEEVADLFAPAPAGLAAYVPRLRYRLIDEGRFPAAELERMPHLTAALFRLEQSRRGPGTAAAFAAFTRGLGGAAGSADLRRAFVAWAGRLAGVAASDRWHDEQEDVMLEQKIRELFEDRRLEGVAEGRAEGRRQGEAEGRKQGEVEGRKQGEVEGRKQGEAEGRKQGEVEVLVRLLERKFGPLDAVSRARLAAADSAQLLGWAERVLTAGRPAEVFAD